MISSPMACAASAFLGSRAGISLNPIGDMPRAVMAPAIVFAVNCPPQAPEPGQALSSSSSSSSFSHSDELPISSLQRRANRIKLKTVKFNIISLLTTLS